jgi:hypothetical protein
MGKKRAVRLKQQGTINEAQIYYQERYTYSRVIAGDFQPFYGARNRLRSLLYVIQF